MFSVVIPLYNKEATIIQTLNTVLNQRFKQYEIIVIDDGSTDNGVELIKCLVDSRIKIFQKENGGVAEARNYGILKASFSWVVFLDADDYWMPEFLEEVYRLINKFPGHRVYATGYIINQYGKSAPLPVFYQIPENWEGVVHNYFEIVGKSASLITSSSVCIHKTIFDEVGYFPLGEKLGEDQEMWIRIAFGNNIVFCNKPLMAYNIGQTSAVKNILPDENLVHVICLRRILESNENIHIRRYLEKELFYIARLNILGGWPKRGRSIIVRGAWSFYFIAKFKWLVISYILQVKSLIK